MRRKFLSLSAAGITALAAAACGGDEELPGVTPQAQPTTGAAQPTGAAAAKYQEAPQFAELVKQGTLPPVAERLPKSPLVVQPVERVGQYGGTWRSALLGGSDWA